MATLKVVRILEIGFFIAASVGVLALMVLLTANVILRLLGAGGIEATVELSSVGMAAVGLLGIAHAQRLDGHVSTDILIRRFNNRTQSHLRRVWMLPTIVVVGWMAYHLWRRATTSFGSSESHWGSDWVLLWPARASVAAAAGLLSLELLRQFIVRRSEAADRSAGRMTS